MKSLHGRYFDHTNVETADVLDNYSPDDESLWEKDALIRLPGGVELSPSGIEVTLIGVYALAGGRMDLLLEALHPDPSSVDAKTWEEIRQCIEGSRPDDKKDSLKVLARQFATWVRGSKVGTGRRPSLSEMDHSVELKASELAEEATLTAPERVKLALENGPAYPWEISETTGIPLKTIKNVLTGLRKQGAVEPIGQTEGQAEQVRLSVPRPNVYRDGTRDTDDSLTSVYVNEQGEA